jgi:hypothetical protein
MGLFLFTNETFTAACTSFLHFTGKKFRAKSRNRSLASFALHVTL